MRKTLYDDDKKVRDHYHITGKFRGAGHWGYNKSLVFINSMQFMNSRLENLVKNLSDNDFKQFSPENLELLKQKDAYSFEYIDSFKEKNT